jgi:hypothetical protein
LLVPTVQTRLACACLLTVLVTFVGIGCTKRLPTVRMTSPFGHSNWIELLDSRVIEGPQPALAVTMKNQKKKPIFVRMVIDELDGRSDCANSIKLLPGVEYPYVCPQASVSAGNRYRAELVVFRDQGNTKPTERLHRLIVLKADENGNLVLDGAPAK